MRTMSRPGVIAGRFQLERLAGAGGMGEVYQARDLHSGMTVALKMARRVDTPGFERFEREAQILSTLDHPGIVRYLAYGVTPDDEPYLAMEWLSGETLGERLRREELTRAETLALGRRVAAALGAVHRHGIVHRDLKPGNLFLRGGAIEDIALIDFGIAWTPNTTLELTTMGRLLGTPGYIAPEQARGVLDVDPRADVFALGCVLFRCLSGRPAFTGDNALSVLLKVLVEEPPRLRELAPDIPPELEDLVARMLAKAPESRPRDGDTVAAELFKQQQEATLLSRGALPSFRVRETEFMSAERRIMCLVMTRCPDGDAVALSSAGSEERERALRAAAERHRSRLAILADGSLLVLLESADTATDLAARAACCAQVISSLLDGAPVVVVSGRRIQRARAPTGELIDRAAQLLGSAEGAPKIGVDEVTAGLLKGRFDLDPDARGTRLWLPGELGDPDGVRTLLGKPTTCVGRELELAQLEMTFARCIDEPVASAVLVTAPPGVGKSRLGHEFLRKLQAKGEAMDIWFGQGDPMSAGSPFGMLAQALRRALGLFEGAPLPARREALRTRIARHLMTDHAAMDRVTVFLGELVGTPFPDEGSVELQVARRDPTVMVEEMQHAFQSFLRAECTAQPVLLVLEDLHWGDLLTVRLIAAALRDLREHRFMVLALARPEVQEIFPKLWGACGLQEIRLGELTRKASERLVRQALGAQVSAEAAARLTALADGNAFYLEELIRAVARGRGEALPETILAMVEARLVAIDPEARRVLRAASVFGEVCWEGGVAALLGGTMQAAFVHASLSRLVEQEVLSRRRESRFSGEQELAFRHALLRAGAYAMLTEEDRALGHRLAGAWLEQHGEAAPTVLAANFERGEEGTREASLLLHRETSRRRSPLSSEVDAC